MKNYLICGYGGIGAALVEQVLAQGDQVTVVTRQKVIPNVTCITLDNLDSTLQQAVPDCIINTIGVLHDKSHTPEKNIQQVTDAWLQHSISVNVMPTVIIAQSLGKVMSRSSKLKFMAIPGRVSSISDNELGGWYSYRMSKAALNMLIKNLAIEWSRQYPKAAIFGFHPGTVDTSLTEPFKSNVPANKLFSATRAANNLLKVLSKLTTKDSGKLIDWEGKSVPF